jgi:hypothetical protein
MFPGCVPEMHEVSVVPGDSNAPMLESAHYSEVLSWIGRCHQGAGGLGMVSCETAMLQADT